MPVETVSWKSGKIKYIDQTLLPHRVAFVTCSTIRALHRALRRLEIRGAPAIGIAGALGVLLAANASRAKTMREFRREMQRAIRFLSTARPTAVNLFWALERMQHVMVAHMAEGLPAIKKRLHAEACAIIDEDKRSCRAMARHGAHLIKNGDCILTHCNAGGLATADYGTALGALFAAHRQGKKIAVYVDETRPLLQGARLTTWELMHAKIETILICDNMAASLMERGMIDAIFVGADRIARNGDTANKIGTYNLAVLAYYHRVPFYVVAPLSTFDTRLPSGDWIPIEERNADEVRRIGGRSIAPRRVRVYNPAFDVTPHRLVSAFVTEKGIIHKPYGNAIKRLKPGSW